MKLFRPYAALRWIFSVRVWRIKSDSKVFLTFDDGPTAELTLQILDILDQYDAKATFFCVGTNAKELPELMNEIRSRGHLIGNHTMHHENALKTSVEDYFDSISAADEFTSSQFFRPPYGRLRMKEALKLAKKYKIVMWTWLSYDFDRSVPVDRILENAERKIRPGDILVLHDNVKVKDRVELLLPALLEVIKRKGLKCELISF
jgi:peptidoglycan/xylan/chitin deacetylase (PgdA/CDA1 family)